MVPHWKIAQRDTPLLYLRNRLALRNSSTMTTTTPKPGPHLHTPTTTAEAAPDPKRAFRELAKRHAIAASDYLFAAEATRHERRAELLELADVAAHVSLACSHIAPPARLRYVHRTDADK